MNLLILGAGCHGCVVKETAEATGMFDKISFLDDSYGRDSSLIAASPVIGTLAEYEERFGEYTAAFPAFGNNTQRMEWIDKLMRVGYYVNTFVHFTAYVSPSAQIGAGTLIEPTAAVSTNSHIGKGCIIALGALVDHDCYIGDGRFINAGTVVNAYTQLPDLGKFDIMANRGPGAQENGNK